MKSFKQALRDFIKALLPHEHKWSSDLVFGGEQCLVCAKTRYPKY